MTLRESARSILPRPGQKNISAYATGVNGRLLDNCQVRSLPHDCVAYRTRLRDHLKAFACVLS